MVCSPDRPSDPTGGKMISVHTAENMISLAESCRQTLELQKYPMMASVFAQIRNRLRHSDRMNEQPPVSIHLTENMSDSFIADFIAEDGQVYAMVVVRKVSLS